MAKQFPRAADGGWYQIKALVTPAGAPTATDIWIYDVIGDDWYAPSLCAQQLCQQIAAIDTDEIVLHFSSPGGSVSDGVAIYNALIAHPAKVSSIIEGWTASIATVIALAADPGCVSMFDNCFFMIHNAWGIAIGDAAALREYADFLDRVSATMVTTYMQRCAKSEDDLLCALAAETYLSAEQALEWGFIDEIAQGTQAAAALAHPQQIDAKTLAALGFEHVPSALFPDPPAPAAAGRTLSAGNETKLSDARDLIEEVLASVDGSSASGGADGRADESGDSDSIVEPGRLAALLARRPW